MTGTNPNQCDTMTYEPSHCIVTEGQRVHFRCSASSKPSKPAPASIRWQGRGNGPDLYIESTNRTQHTGTYNCTVETGSYGSDSRLPLRGWNAITVLVKCELHDFYSNLFVSPSRPSHAADHANTTSSDK